MGIRMSAWGLRPWAVLLVLLSVVLTAALVGTACGGGDDSGDSQAEQSSSDRAPRDDRESTVPAEEESAQGQAQSPQPRQEGELRIARGEPLTLDPALTTDATSASYVVEIFGGLLILNRNLEIEPDLTEAMPEAQENGDGTVTYRFVLRRDALFHNGERVTAEDVKWSLERNLHPDTFSPTAVDFLGDIVGAVDFNRGRAEEIAGVEVVDERTIDITIDAPKPYFLYKLTYPTAFVVDRAQVENDPTNWTRNPNGTGPFKLREWDLGEQLILERNDQYHLGPALLPSVRVRFAGGGLTQYENNEVDIADVGINDIERARDPASPLNDEFVARSELSIFYLGFNTSQPPFDDPDVRRALAMAIDKQTLVEVVLQGIAPVANGIIPPGMAGYDEDYAGLPFDPERAEELLQNSDYADSPLLDNIRLTIPGAGATPGPVIEAIQQMWLDNLGLTIELQQVETANFYSELDRGLYQMFNIGWIMDYPDPENILDLKFHSRSLQNEVALRDPEIDAALEAARTEQDPEERIRIYQEVEHQLVEDAVWIPLFYGESDQVVKPYVEGYEPVRSVVPYLRFISLSN